MASKGGKSSSSKSNPSDFQPHKPDEPLQEEELEALYAWVDSIPLSRPKRNISRDFADGVLVAECLQHFFPSEGLVELHNYTGANSTPKKKENWYYLNRKVFPKLNFELAEDVINDLCSCKAGMIEKVLMMLKVKIKSAEYARGHQSDKPEVDQHQMTPGRKTIKVGMEDTKGSRFVKTKHDTDIEFEPKNKVKFKDEKDRRDKKALRLQDQKSPPKMPPKPAVTQKRRTGPVVESDMVPRYVVEEKEQEVLSRDETIQILQAKIQRMEHLLQLKDIRIAELTDHADRCEQNGYTHIHGSQQKPVAQSHGVHQGAQAHGVFYKPSLYSYSH